MKKQFSRLLTALLVVLMIAGLSTTAFAATSTTAVIDETKTGSITIYKYDTTNAEKDGVWSNSYVSTGVYDQEINDILGGTVPKGDSDNESVQGNGQSSYGYAIKGVEFSYLKVAKIRTYSETETQSSGKVKSVVEVLYGIPQNDNLLTIIGLTGDDRYAPADIAGENIWYYRSDVLISALRTSLNAQPTATKNALEAYIANNNGAKMDQTDSYGFTSVSGLPLGLYLVVETAVPERVTCTTEPFFLSLPMTNVDGGFNGSDYIDDGGDKWLYDVTLYPKNLTGIPTLEKTLREAKADGGKNNGSDTITDGFAHTATATGGDVVEYQIISTLPTITSDATELSTYTFKDTLSDGLRYNEDSVKIEWFQDKACTQKVATWDTNGENFSAVFGVNGNKTTMTVTMTADGLDEINNSNAVYAADTVRRGYSDLTMRITYSTTLEADDTLECGEEGNDNVVTLEWQRTSSDYIDLLIDDCHVHTFGIELTKLFSDNRGDFSEVEFVIYNETDKQWVVARQDANTGIYYVQDWAAQAGTTDDGDKILVPSDLTALISDGEEMATWDTTVFKPTDEGKILLKGAEDDSYILTEINTDNGYTLLKDHINVKIVAAENEVCDIYASDVKGLIQNDPRYDWVNANQYENMPQKHLEHKLLTAKAYVDDNEVTMLSEDSSAQAFAPLTVTNTKGFALPQTGESGARLLPLFGVFGIFVALLVISFVVFDPRRKKDAE